MLQTGKELIIVIQELQVKFNALPDTLIGEPLSNAFPVCFVGDFLSYVRKIVLVIGILDMGQKFCPFVREMHPASEKIPG